MGESMFFIYQPVVTYFFEDILLFTAAQAA